MSGSLSLRWRRFWLHLTAYPGFGYSKEQKHELPFPCSFSWRWLERLFLLFDLFYIPDILVFISRFIKPNTRKLSKKEVQLAQTVFGNSIRYNKVLLDERAFIGPMTIQMAYVGFGVVHSWGKLRPTTFIHELVHVWQYQKLGGVYIPRALYAQRTPEGYDYGGPKFLRLAKNKGQRFLDFNYEQQGDIVADYFALETGTRPMFCKPNPDYLPDFEVFIEELGPNDSENIA